MKPTKFKVWIDSYNRMEEYVDIRVWDKDDHNDFKAAMENGGILLQYIDSHDKCGVDIYEDYILQDVDGGKAVVEFYKNRFTYRYETWPDDLPLPNEFHWANEFKVIGNIHENKGLYEKHKREE
jgi:hypothetical protein